MKKLREKILLWENFYKKVKIMTELLYSTMKETHWSDIYLRSSSKTAEQASCMLA